jgi:predicted Zn-dependent peptidase
MPSICYETIRETLFQEVLPNGLAVYLVPKAGFSKTYAVFATRYGSIDTHFKAGDGPESRVVDGIAHFLEHKLFEEPEGDITHTFAAQGASTNAYTTHHCTAYLFSATSQVEKNLETLINFVQRPHLSPESVEKEKGIIEQEIRMYDEMPYWRGYRHLLEGLFHKHPVRIDIAGTVESITAIDRAALLDCYKTFYHPSNMLLCVVGDFEPERLLEIIRANQAAKNYPKAPVIQRFVEQEPTSIRAARHEISLAVSRPLALYGWKDQALAHGAARLRKELVMSIVQDLIFGRTSDLSQDLLDRGLIDDSFAFDYEAGPGYGFSYVGTETDDVEAFEAALYAGLKRVLESGLNKDDFERARRKQIGNYLHALNSPEAIANNLIGILFKGGDYFHIPDLLAELTFEEAQAALRSHFNLQETVASLVFPSGESPEEAEISRDVSPQ